MSGSIYNPLATISVNDNAFHEIQSEIERNRGKDIPQPILIVGQNGSGKTTLLERIYRANKNRNIHWIDGRTIFSTDDITGHVKEAKDAVLLIDDIDFFFLRCSYDEQFKLRRYLYNEGSPMLIGGICKILPAFTEYKAPFFEGLKMIYLSLGSEGQTFSQYFGNHAERADALLGYLPRNIRSLIITDCIIKLNDNQDKDLDMLVSLYSETYRDIYNRQSAYSQHILNALGPANNGMELPEIREKTQLQTSILTSYLKLMQTHSIISADKSIKKHTRYTVIDPLFRLWLAQCKHP